MDGVEQRRNIETTPRLSYPIGGRSQAVAVIVDQLAQLALEGSGHGQESRSSTRTEGYRAGTLRSSVISVASLAWAKAAR